MRAIHAKLSPEEISQIWEAAQRHKRERAERLPTDAAALQALLDVYERLKELGWREAIYCPKDGTIFDAIEVGSTGIHDCYYDGEWPDGSWWVIAADDLWPSRPILWRPKASVSPQQAEGEA